MTQNSVVTTSSLTLHLVSDATGGTLQSLAEAALAQFEGTEVRQKLWPSIRTQSQLERVLKDLESNPGPVFYTLVEHTHIEKLEATCADLKLPCISVMGPFMKILGDAFQQTPRCKPGLQHVLDEAYFRRIEAIDFAMSFDDGQSLEGIETAEVILVGVSRTSKTPTCVYLARHGIRAANIPLVPHQDFPSHVLGLTSPLFVGLTESPDRLIQLRSSRLKIDQKQGVLSQNAYIDPEKVEEEVQKANRFIRQQGWPLLDVTRRSVEETAAEIMVLLQNRKS